MLCEKIGLQHFVCAKGVVGAKSTGCDRALLQFGSDVQKGSFFNNVSDNGGVLFWEYPLGIHQCWLSPLSLSQY